MKNCSLFRIPLSLLRMNSDVYIYIYLYIYPVCLFVAVNVYERMCRKFRGVSINTRIIVATLSNKKTKLKKTDFLPQRTTCRFIV